MILYTNGSLMLSACAMRLKYEHEGLCDTWPHLFYHMTKLSYSKIQGSVVNKSKCWTYGEFVNFDNIIYTVCKAFEVILQGQFQIFWKKWLLINSFIHLFQKSSWKLWVSHFYVYLHCNQRMSTFDISYISHCDINTVLCGVEASGFVI